MQQGQLSRGDIYRLQALMALQQAQQESQQPQQQGGGISSILQTAGGLEGGKEVASAIGGGSSALSGAGAMSVQPAMDLATVKSLSTGGSGLMTQAPTAMQSSIYTPAAETGIAANAAGMGVAPLAAIAAGTYLGGKSAYNLLKGKKDDSLGGKAGRVTLGIATGGLSEVARPFLMRESTRDRARKNTKSLYEQAANDPTALNYFKGMREQYNSAPKDPSKPFAGKYRSWDEYKKAGLEASDLTGVYGNLKTFGNDWARLSQDQRQKVTQGIIDAGLYDSKKGEVNITDPNKALQIKQQVLSQQNQARKK